MDSLRNSKHFKYAIERLPANGRIEQVVLAYLAVLFEKPGGISEKAWEVIIDELVLGLKLNTQDIAKAKQKTRARVIGADKSNELIDQIVYLFQVGTIRKSNHVYITPEQDASRYNMSYYQDPYWTALISHKKTRAELEAILNGQ